jgi:hypothetical protein
LASFCAVDPLADLREAKGMPLYFHDNRTIDHRIATSDLPFDLVLLQDSKMNIEFWQPVVQDLQSEDSQAGRILLCNWWIQDLSNEALSEGLEGLLRSLGFQGIRMVACGDSAEVASLLQKHQVVEIKKLQAYRQTPSMDDLINAIHGF